MIGLIFNTEELVLYRAWEVRYAELLQLVRDLDKCLDLEAHKLKIATARAAEGAAWRGYCRVVGIE